MPLGPGCQISEECGVPPIKSHIGGSFPKGQWVGGAHARLRIRSERGVLRHGHAKRGKLYLLCPNESRDDMQEVLYPRDTLICGSASFLPTHDGCGTILPQVKRERD